MSYSLSRKIDRMLELPYEKDFEDPLKDYKMLYDVMNPNSQTGIDGLTWELNGCLRRSWAVAE